MTDQVLKVLADISKTATDTAIKVVQQEDKDVLRQSIEELKGHIAALEKNL